MNKLIIFACFVFNFTSLFAQLDKSKNSSYKYYKSESIFSEKQGEYLVESKKITKTNDTITFWLDATNRVKKISIKNKATGINNDQFHRYAGTLNPTFTSHSLIEKKVSNHYFNEEKNKANVRIYSNNTKSMGVEIQLISDLKMIEKLLIED
jgi:hypothetical protein